MHHSLRKGLAHVNRESANGKKGDNPDFANFPRHHAAGFGRMKFYCKNKIIVSKTKVK